MRTTREAVTHRGILVSGKRKLHSHCRGRFLFLPLSAVIIRGEYREVTAIGIFRVEGIRVTYNHPFPRVCGCVDDGREVRCDSRREGKKKGKERKTSFPPLSGRIPRTLPRHEPAQSISITRRCISPVHTSYDDFAPFEL